MVATMTEHAEAHLAERSMLGFSKNGSKAWMLQSFASFADEQNCSTVGQRSCDQVGKATVASQGPPHLGRPAGGTDAVCDLREAFGSGNGVSADADSRQVTPTIDAPHLC
jgi:hypothetical protein